MSVNGINNGNFDPRQAMFSRMDASGDGKIDKGEMEAFAQMLSQQTGQTISAEQLIAMTDQNGDGSLDIGEMPPPPPPPQGEWGGKSSFEKGRGPNPFAKLDADGSGGLSATELQAMAQRVSQRTGQSVTGDQLLAKLDTDGDGQVSSTEMDSGREQMRKQLQSQLGQARTWIR